VTVLSDISMQWAYLAILLAVLIPLSALIYTFTKRFGLRFGLIYSGLGSIFPLVLTLVMTFRVYETVADNASLRNDFIFAVVVPLFGVLELAWCGLSAFFIFLGSRRKGSRK